MLYLFDELRRETSDLSSTEWFTCRNAPKHYKPLTEDLTAYLRIPPPVSVPKLDLSPKPCAKSQREFAGELFSPLMAEIDDMLSQTYLQSGRKRRKY